MNLARPEGPAVHTPDGDPRQAATPISAVPGESSHWPKFGYRTVRIPAGAHITVHYSVDEEHWCVHLHALRGRTDHGPVVEEVDPGERIARYRVGFTSYVAHCLDASRVTSSDGPPEGHTDAEERS